ncbi:MAG TPA: hypothetical protein VG247_21975 [Pseudonocardiaceae bacterium]|nr:hypothetical protein [Pseudonocardiaceae bacterium]
MLSFGEPYEMANGTVIVTVSRKGWGKRPERPLGLYTIRADGTTWTPAAETGRPMTILACAGFLAAALSTAAVLRRPPWPEMTERVMTALAQTRSR